MRALQNAGETLNNGSSDYIIKPLDVDDALEVIESLLQKQQQQLIMTQEKIVEYTRTKVKQTKQECANSRSEVF